jgi:hypothetical protein
MALTKAHFRMIDGSPVNVRDFGAVGDGVTDDTAAIQAAIDYASTRNIPNVIALGTYAIESTVIIKDGVTLYGGENPGNPIYRNGVGWERESNGSIIYVNFGSGLSPDNYANTAITLYDNSGIRGFAFVYLGQDMTATTATSFPPTISIAPTRNGMTISDCCFVNSYSAIDARRDHALLTVKNCKGYPLRYGIRLGSMTDNDYIQQVHFQPLEAYRGSVNASNSLAGWVNENGTAIDLGRVSWSVLDSVFAFGYNQGINMYYQTATTDVTNPGGVETLHVNNCGFDSCYFGIYATHVAQAGTTHYGVHVTNTFFAPTDAYNAARVQSRGIFWDMDALTTGDSALTVNTCRFWGADDVVIECINSRGVNITDSTFFSWGENAATNCIIFKAVNSSNITNCMFDCQAVVNNVAIRLENNCSYTVISNNSFYDHSNEAIYITAASNVRYVITSNSFDASSGTPDPITDNAQDPNSFIQNNVSDNLGFTVSSVVSNVLQIPVQGEFFTYTGTTGFNDISNKKAGRRVTIKFDDVATVTDGTALKMAGNFTSSADDTLTLVCDGTAWFEVTRSVN